MNPEAQQLEEGLQRLGLSLPVDMQVSLLKYMALMQKWNKTYNLTAVRDQEKMVSHHLLDSLAVLPYIKGTRILDVGSGAGLPGIPLALARPEWSVSLMDSNHKKAAFLKQVAIELQLENTEVHHHRVDEWVSSKPYDVVISRAFADLAEFVRLAGRLCGETGQLLAMKGLYPYEELAQLPQGFTVDRVIPLTVPGLQAERHLVVIKPS